MRRDAVHVVGHENITLPRAVDRDAVRVVVCPPKHHVEGPRIDASLLDKCVQGNTLPYRSADVLIAHRIADALQRDDLCGGRTGQQLLIIQGRGFGDQPSDREAPLVHTDRRRAPVRRHVELIVRRDRWRLPRGLAKQGVEKPAVPLSRPGQGRRERQARRELQEVTSRPSEPG